MYFSRETEPVSWFTVRCKITCFSFIPDKPNVILLQLWQQTQNNSVEPKTEICLCGTFMFSTAAIMRPLLGVEPSITLLCNCSYDTVQLVPSVGAEGYKRIANKQDVDLITVLCTVTYKLFRSLKILELEYWGFTTIE